MNGLGEKALDIAKNYVDLVLKAPLAEFGGILSDSIGYWRLKNRVNLILKAKKTLMDKKNVTPQQIGPNVLEGSGSLDRTKALILMSYQGRSTAGQD